MRRWPYIVRAGDRYKVRRYIREVLITLVLVLAITPLAIIYIANNLGLGILLANLG